MFSLPCLWNVPVSDLFVAFIALVLNIHLHHLDSQRDASQHMDLQQIQLDQLLDLQHLVLQHLDLHHLDLHRVDLQELELHTWSTN